MKQQLSLGIAIFLFSFIFAPSQVIAQATTSAGLKEQHRVELRERIQQKRVESREQFKARRETLKNKIATIRDEKKKAVVERLDTKLSTINTNRTNKMSEHLEKLSAILARIQERAATAKINGKDTSAVDTAIANAQTAIANAESAVATQAGKEYVITIASEATLRNTVGITTSQLQLDLQTMHNAVIAAKQAVQFAAMELAKVIGTLGIKTSTTSAREQ